jgi:hypothetical protein
MPTKKVNARPNWRCRREEYLRATGRREELISEGYQAAPRSPQWTVLAGGRHEIHKERPSAKKALPFEGDKVVTRILGNGRVVRETATLIRKRALLIELRAVSLAYG